MGSIMSPDAVLHAIVLGVALGLVVLIPILWNSRREERSDPFVVQARIDQNAADYPGCVLGLMQCRSWCGCNERLPCAAFVSARAKFLREQAGKGAS